MCVKISLKKMSVRILGEKQDFNSSEKKVILILIRIAAILTVQIDVCIERCDICVVGL